MKSLKLYPDRRMFWLKTIYLQLYKESAMDVNGERNQGPRPYEALQAFGGRVERWKGFGRRHGSNAISCTFPLFGITTPMHELSISDRIIDAMHE